MEGIGQTCNLTIPIFSGSNAILAPVAGGSIAFSGSISESSGQSVTWTLNVLDHTFGGSGSSVSATWDGKLSDGTVVKPGSYSATLTGTTADGQCTDSKTVNFTVSPAPDGQCGLYVQFGSSAHLASGNLNHSQSLFSTQGGSLPLGVALYYNSLDPANSTLGRGWSHSYDYSLKQNSDGSVLISLPNWRYKYYTPSASGYSTQPGNYSVLTKSGSGFLLTERDGTLYRFNPDGTLAFISDRNANSQALSYESGRLTQVSDPSGRTATFSYNGSGRISAIIDPQGNSYGLSGAGKILVAVTQPDSGSWRFTYDDNGFMQSKVDPQNNTVSYEYDASHRVVGSSDPVGSRRSISYPTSGATELTTTFTEKDGGLWSYRYDSQKGQLLAKTDPQGGTTSYGYDANNNRTSVVAPDGSRTDYSYDSAGNQTSMTDATGQTTRYTYNSFGQVTAVIDPQNNITSYQYDSKGNLLSLTDPAGATTGYQYDNKGNITRITNPAGAITSFGYDAGGNLISVTDPAGSTTRYSYDAIGNVTTVTDAKGAVTRFFYDSRNRLIKTVNPQGNATTYAYDVNGNKISSTDANGNTTKYEYNARNQLVKTIDALGNSTVYAYSEVDKLASLTDANRNSTRYDYDQLGRLTRESDPLGNAVRYSYDSKGNLIAKTDAKGQIVSYSYDANNRLLKKTYPDSSEESYSYDAKGNILTAANKNISYSFTYDATGRMLTSSDSFGNVISYQYDAAGRKTRIGYPDGSVVAYGYDTAGRLSSITVPNGASFNYSYTSLGQRSKLTYPNGVTTGYQYDSAGNLTSFAHKAYGRNIASFGYTHDKVGNRITKTDNTLTINYGYDAIYRLLTAQLNRHHEHQHNEQYSYDPVGNRLTGPNQNTDYSYGPGNQLLKREQTSYQYDANGNLSERGHVAGQFGNHHAEHHNKPWKYSFDFENRLIKAETGQGHERTIVIFTYDPLGRRIEKKVEKSEEHNKHDDDADTGITHYLYDGQSIIQETRQKDEQRSSRQEATTYVHGPNIDEPLQGTSKDKTWYYHADGLGSVVALTDKRGNVVQSYSYDSFGNLHQEGEQIRQPFAYTGRIWDPELRLHDYRARTYDQQLGRFMQRDPIGFAGGDVNLYAYVGSNVINKVDPTGLKVSICYSSLSMVPFRWFPGTFQHASIVTSKCGAWGFHPTNLFARAVLWTGEVKDDSNLNFISCPELPGCIDEDCVCRKIRNAINNPGLYGGILFYNCISWARQIVSECSR